MLQKVAVAGIIAGAGFFYIPQIAGAAGVASPGALVTTSPVVEHVQYRHCRGWYRECRARWGGGWRFRRCLARHGC
jgi:hypothetical protein